MKRWLPYLVYALLSCGILGSLLVPGYILTLDMVFAPHADFTGLLYGLDPSWLSASAPFYALMGALDNLVPAWFIQKVILFLLIFLSGLGAHRLFPYRGVGAYFAGLLYMVNPFTYVRFLAGQWGVLASYAAMPFAVKAFLSLLEAGGIRNAVVVALLSTLVGLLQPHGFFLLLTAFVVLLIVKLVSERSKPAMMAKAGKFAALALAMFLGLNAYWLLPALTSTWTILPQIGLADLYFFAPSPSSSLGTVFDLAAMYGFWRGGYIHARDLLPYWWLVFAFILYLAVSGFFYRVRDSRLGWIVKSFGVLWAVGLVLAAAATLEAARPLLAWLFDHSYIIRGFRDLQKFVALLCLCYSFLGGLALHEFAELAARSRLGKTNLRRAGIIAVIILGLIVPCVYSYAIFNLHGQVGATDYPEDWYVVNEHLRQDESDFNVLFLPWHMYMDYSWLPNRDKRLSNPAHDFFAKPVVAGDNIEAGGIYSESTSPVSNYVEFLLAKADSVDNFGELLAPLNVKYVILAHEADYRSYDFLYQQSDLAIEMESGSLTLFRSTHPTARVYAVGSVVHVEDLEEYLALSKEQDVMHHMYVLEEAGSDASGDEFEALGFTQRSPVEYKVEGSQKSWTVFTLPQRFSTAYWLCDGVPPVMKNLGFMPVFKIGSDGGTITYSRFYRVYLPGYIVSAIVLAALLAVYFWFRRDSARTTSQ